jgi:hypothetical protein
MVEPNLRHVQGEQQKQFLLGTGVGAQLTAITTLASIPKYTLG